MVEKPGCKLPPPIKVRPGQIWMNPDGHRVMVNRVDRGWVSVINEFGTIESYAIGKLGRDQIFHAFRFHKNYERPEDFPKLFS